MARTPAPTYQGVVCLRGHDGTRYVKGGMCVRCAIEGGRKWAARNPDGRRAIAAKYRAANRAACHARTIEWQHRNKERVNAQSRARVLTNLIRSQRKRARRLGALSRGVTAAEWLTILDEYGHRCAYCATPGKLEMDHVDALGHGGLHEPNNVVPACMACNRRKHGNSIIIWLAGGRSAKARVA